MRGRGVLAYPQVAEEPFEEVGLAHIVVLAQHVHQQRLAEAARADEEEIAVGTLNLGDEAGLIDIIVVGEAHVLPVLHPVGDSFGVLLFGGHGHSGMIIKVIHAYNYAKIRQSHENPKFSRQKL